MMNLNSAMRISSTGMTAERFRMDVIAGNIAGANTMRTATADAYRRKTVVLTGNANGVQVSRIDTDPTELRRVSDPANPNADAEGFVYYSNVQPIHEMVDMIGASRAYEANIQAFNSARSMIRAALTIGKL